MNVPTYSPHELVRIELVSYPNPDGLHPMEESYRNLTKKLLEHIDELQEGLVTCKVALPHYNKTLENWKPFVFPKPYTGVRPE